ncbi:MAG: RagB/SusD family nutrient uptake outer membrane protein [Bacteroidales bacterium]|nr:RagB/SusD family nutrient uptake outer membrane protein [Bacteroidales bacterium]
MKTIYKNIAAVLFCSASLFLVGCDDMLETEPYGQFTDEQLDDDAIEGLIAAAYAGVEAHFFGNNPAFSGPSTNWIFDVRSDDALKGGGGISMESNIHQLEISNLTSTNPSCLYKWQNNYYAISRVHTAINAVSGASSLSESTKATYFAELKFLRAFYYFDLYRLFERFPYFTEEDNANEIRYDRYTRDEMFKLIVADLEEAYNNLPTSQPAAGRVNKYGAAAMLARVNAYESRWNEVATYAKAVIDSNVYSLYDNFGDMSKISFNNTKESIFALQCSNVNDNSHINWSNLLNVTYSEGNLYGNGDDFFLASQNLVNAFRTNPDTGLPYLNNDAPAENVSENYSGSVDPRLDYTVGRVGYPWRDNGTGAYIYGDAWCRAKDVYGEYSGKKWCISPDDPMCLHTYPYSSPLNFIFIRYADVILLRAEALIELGDNSGLNEARTLINQVRAKAIRTADQAGNYTPVDLDVNKADYFVQEYPASGWTQDYARKAVRMERRLELAMEGQRWFDLCRWGNVVDVMNAYFQSESKFHSYYGEASMDASEKFLPIPYDEVNNSYGLYE